MGLASLGNAYVGVWHFRVDPDSVSWNYSVKIASIPTIGGKVVQVFGTRLSDMTVTGAFGKGGYAEQMKFLQFVQNMDASTGQVLQNTAPPLRFVYPPKQWDFMVYLTSFTQVGAQSSVRASNADFNPHWSLTFFLVNQNNKLKTIATDGVISRLAAGLGWTIDQFNGPGTSTVPVNAVQVGA